MLAALTVMLSFACSSVRRETLKLCEDLLLDCLDFFAEVSTFSMDDRLHQPAAISSTLAKILRIFVYSDNRAGLLLLAFPLAFGVVT